MSTLRTHRSSIRTFCALSLLILGLWSSASAPGCAAVVGGAAGAGTGYIAGHEAGEHEVKEHEKTQHQ